MKEKLPFIILCLIAVLMVLQALRAQGVLAKELEEVKVIGIGLGTDKQAQANNYDTVSGEEVRALSTNHLSEVLNRLPGFNIQHGSGQEHLTAIRSPVLTGGSGAGSFLFLEDGVPLRAAGFGNVNGLLEALPELAGAIEAVRGPSSALYGSNAVHGAVNVLSQAPSEQREVNADLRFGIEPFSGRFLASTSSPIGARIGARVGFSYRKDNGWRASSGLEHFKGQLRVDNRFSGGKSKTLISFHRLDQQTAGFLPDYRNDILRNEDPDAYRRAQAVRAQNNTLISINPNNQINLTSWFRWTRINFLMHFLPTTPIEKNFHYSVGARPVWQTQLQQTLVGDFDFNAGVEFEYTHGSLSEIQSAPGMFAFFQGTHYDYNINAYTLAFFTQNDWRLPDENTTLTFGLRGEWVRYDYDNKTDSGTHNNSTSNSALYRPSDRTHDFFTITPKIGVSYRLPEMASQRVFAFANYTRGQRAPQTTDLYRIRYRDRNAKFRPERLESIEFGFRGAGLRPSKKATRLGIARPNFSWQLVGFFMDKANHHFRNFNFDPVVNGKTRHAGAELDFLVEYIGISLRTAFTYAHHWYNFSRTDANITKGDDIDTAPRVLLNMELSYTHERGKASIEFIRVGKYWTDPQNAHLYGGHNVLNLRASVNVWREIDFFFHILNLADARYADRADFGSVTDRDGNRVTSDRYFPGQPRSFQLGLRGSF